jgi:hypothetical protein
MLIEKGKKSNSLELLIATFSRSPLPEVPNFLIQNGQTKLQAKLPFVVFELTRYLIVRREDAPTVCHD